ncbi:MAG: PadR family transcriptional regulator [Actinobacteria bacterium]|jgi:DNA-binding PadR family transcriptional regulator|nr:PadR family transcriptional regulator [Actinomycetota bacterium]
MELAILGLLKEEPLHGYELRKRLRERLGILANVSFGSLYPALARLESLGAIIATEPRDAPPIPMTGSLHGERGIFDMRRSSKSKYSATTARKRKVYNITPLGEEHFARMLADIRAVDNEQAFDIHLAFAKYLTIQARLALLERRKSLLLSKLNRINSENKGKNAHINQEIVSDPYTNLLRDHSRASLENEIAWIDDIIKAESRSIKSEKTPTSPLKLSKVSAPYTTTNN